MLLNFLGRGSAFNVKEGNNCAYIKNDSQLLLIDCGEGIFERIISKGILDGINNVNVIITHIHSDHSGSLSSLLYYCYYIKHITVEVYFPDNHLRDLLKMLGNVENRDYIFNKLEKEKSIHIGSVKVQPVKVNHSNEFTCYGYIIGLGNKKIWYSGDCRGVSDIVNKYDFDEIYQDTCLGDYEGNVHTSLRVLCESIPRDKRKNVYCMQIDCDELIEKAKEEGFNVVENYKF